MQAATIAVGPEPIFIICPQCSSHIQTVVVREAGAKAYISCGILMLFGCVFGCCLLPFCIDSLNYKVHRCPMCKCFIGRYDG